MKLVIDTAPAESLVRDGEKMYEDPGLTKHKSIAESALSSGANLREWERYGSDYGLIPHIPHVITE